MSEAKKAEERAKEFWHSELFRCARQSLIHDHGIDMLTELIEQAESRGRALGLEQAHQVAIREILTWQSFWDPDARVTKTISPEHIAARVTYVLARIEGEGAGG